LTNAEYHHHHHKHQGLGHLTRSVSRVTAALASVSSVSQLFSFPVDRSGMILKGFGVVAFFAGVRAEYMISIFLCVVGTVYFGMKLYNDQRNSQCVGYGVSARALTPYPADFESLLNLYTCL
jgi:hypothetical protein